VIPRAQITACVAARSDLVDAGELASTIRDRAPHVEVALTGRGCPDVLLDLADYLTELRPVRHPFECGVPARKGVEY
jgi:cob(I)alamin adenosyltransferase